MVKKRKSTQTITDVLLEPFFISKDEFCFTVKQNVKTDGSHFKSKGEGKIYEKSLHYFATFEEALTKIAKLKCESDSFHSLEEYINNYKTISNQIKDYTDEIRSII